MHWEHTDRFFGEDPILPMWVAGLICLQGNLEYLETCVAEHIPQIRVVEPEATYLVWLDCQMLGLDRLALERLMREEAQVYLDEGYIFGPEGEGFERIKLACPRSILAQGLDRIRKAIDRLPVHAAGSQGRGAPANQLTGGP